MANQRLTFNGTAHTTMGGFGYYRSEGTSEQYYGTDNRGQASSTIIGKVPKKHKLLIDAESIPAYSLAVLEQDENKPF